MSFLHYFMKKKQASVFNRRLALKPARFACSTADAHEQFRSYVAVVSFLMRTYLTNDVIAETVGEILSLFQGKGKMAAAFTHSLYYKALQCGNMFPES